MFRESFDDLVEGKGKGIVFLLHGPPGVGKTLTAESITENMRVPLYSLSAGDIALDSYEIETKLREVFKIYRKWHAILLLDEADVFLEQRSQNELERNKLVSIFLRLLEYYEGIMFLATNRVDAFDAAFYSRIHCFIHYPGLSFESRRMVWQSLLTAAKLDSCITDQQLEQLARWDINGRRIKNALKTGQLLAKSKKESFAYKHVVFGLNTVKATK